MKWLHLHLSLLLTLSLSRSRGLSLSRSRSRCLSLSRSRCLSPWLSLSLSLWLTVHSLSLVPLSAGVLCKARALGLWLQPVPLHTGLPGTWLPGDGCQQLPLCQTGCQRMLLMLSHTFVTLFTVCFGIINKLFFILFLSRFAIANESSQEDIMLFPVFAKSMGSPLFFILSVSLYLIYNISPIFM